jgi:hypothetical protein
LLFSQPRSCITKKNYFAEKFCNVCVGDKPYCDSVWLSHPNLNAALMGIDMPSMTLVPDGSIAGPGVKQQIFQSTYREEFGSMAQYDYITSIDDLKCNAQFEEHEYSTFEDLINGWSSILSTGAGMQLGGPINIENKGVTFQIPPMMSASHTKSDEHRKLKRHFDNRGGSVAHSKAECSIYLVMVDIDHPNLKLFSGFEATLLDMDEKMRNATTIEKKKEIGRKFIEKYGTHYSIETKMGSSIHFETRYNKSETINSNKDQRKHCNSRQGMRIFGFQTEKDTNGCEGLFSDNTLGDIDGVRRAMQKTTGAYPVPFKGASVSLSAWSNQLQTMHNKGKS